jgi:uncharacterized protein YhbP (UPF0306 family)
MRIKERVEMTGEEFDEAAKYWLQKDEAGKKPDKDRVMKEAEKFILSNNVCALATGSGPYIRCTPVEYTYHDGAFWIFSEGGLKFRGLRDNSSVSLAIYDKYEGFGKLKGLQVSGRAEMTELFSDEYIKAAEYKKIPVEVLKKLPSPMHLIKIIPQEMDLLDSGLKAEGYDPRQHISIGSGSDGH